MRPGTITLLLVIFLSARVWAQDPVEQPPWHVPEGWSYVLNVGPPEIYRYGESSDGTGTMEIDTHMNAGILARDVSLANDADVTLRWDWQVDTLPSAVSEMGAETHDYLSVAVLFDNGQDMSYMWSSTMADGTVFRCPLPDWIHRETHLVIRSDPGKLGQWLTEERNIRADYAKYIGGEMPARIVQVWLIANTVFQSGVGTGRVANISIGNESEREKVL